MLFVVTTKWKPENMAVFIRMAMEEMPKPPPKGTKNLGTHTLLERCQMVPLVDAPDEKTMLKIISPIKKSLNAIGQPVVAPEDVAKALTE